MTITEALNDFWKVINDHNLDVGGMDDEDVIVYALNKLRADADLEFWEKEDEDEDTEEGNEGSTSSGGAV